MKFLMTLIVLLVAISTATDAQARHSKRDGFNFGTSVRMLSQDDRADSSVDTGNGDIHQTSSSQSVSPYLGYVFGNALNLGLMGLMENGTTTRQESDTETGKTMKRTQETDVRGASLFARFLFAQVLYFEAGAGLYDQTVSVQAEERSASDDGTFSGSSQNYKVHGTGPGYHVGGGVELPIVDGFHFTSSYLVRIYQLRDVSGGGVGAKRGNEQRREVAFGLSYYYQ